MINPIKYTTGSESLALKKGNFYIGTGDVGKGPSDVTGYYQGVSPSGGGYVIYMNKPGAPGDLSYHNATNDSELISFTNNLAGTSYTTVQECLVYFAGQTDKVVFNRDYEPIVTDGLVLDFDPGFTLSYPKSGTSVNDISGAGNNCAVYNGPTFSTNAGGSFVFDGTNDYAGTTTTAIGNSLTGNLTFSVFAKRNGNSATAINGLISNEWHSALTGVSMFLRNNDTQISIEIGNGTTRPAYSLTSPFSNRNWVNYTLTIQGNIVSVYVNGKLLDSRSATILQDPNRGLVLGLWAGSYLSEYYLNGEIFNALVYNRSLSSNEVLQNYQALFPRALGENIVTSGMVLYLDAGYNASYPGSGTTWSDVSGYGNNGTLVNGPTYSSANGGYITCDGVNDYIEVLDNPSLDFGSGSFTVEYWFRKLATTTGFDNIWGPNKWNTGGQPGTNEWLLTIGNGTTGNNNIYEFVIQSESTSYAIASSDQLLLNTWYQLVGQRDGATLKTYLNGDLKLNSTPSGMTTLTSVNNVGRNLRINNSAVNSLYTNADNAIVRIYSRALSAQEILQNYNAQKARFGL